MTGDPGLQPQRTALAWQRTGLGVLITAGAAGIAALRHGFPLWALITLLCGLLICYVAVRHFPKGPDRDVGTDSIWTSMTATVAVVVATSLAGTVLAVAGTFSA
ncbi:DUF202 domain-containing protein [Gordonia hydrophobica]|uniref:DUF202 domain-containing protein n=1 Tax=Gordonia hydrophobica TaxID=40516 RepID=A0ABZ2U219_9ACTN|nr:DUF202 domain-containing protein [Gordonia hydrophobica]MBM7368421.1 uncharacterized membrane protein YidH (DUF202 family) [Gordonia hydrophobica]